MAGEEKANELAGKVRSVAHAWRDSPYYADAERWTHLFWNPDSVFRKSFEKLDLTSVVELACGHGRHAEQCVARCQRITLIDIFQENIDKCRERLHKYQNVEYILGDGSNFSTLKTNSITSIFSYDAMVHFHQDVVLNYVSDAIRILLPGGHFLLHHSNYFQPNSTDYAKNPHARNHFDWGIFENVARQTGFDIESSTPIRWGYEADLDRVTLLRKRG